MRIEDVGVGGEYVVVDDGCSPDAGAYVRVEGIEVITEQVGRRRQERCHRQARCYVTKVGAGRGSTVEGGTVVLAARRLLCTVAAFEAARAARDEKLAPALALQARLVELFGDSLTARISGESVPWLTLTGGVGEWQAALDHLDEHTDYLIAGGDPA